MAYAHRQGPSAPTMDPIDNIHPIPPVRSEYNHDPQQQAFLPPRVPDRFDKPSTTRPQVDLGSRRNANEEENTADENIDSTCNYNRYATKKTIGHILFAMALLTSNAMQLRTLILQKQRDEIWIASLILVCVSILSQFGLFFLLYLLIKGDIRNASKERNLERWNNLAFVLTLLIALVNMSINFLMLTINSKSFLDTRSLEILQRES